MSYDQYQNDTFSTMLIDALGSGTPHTSKRLLQGLRLTTALGLSKATESIPINILKYQSFRCPVISTQRKQQLTKNAGFYILILLLQLPTMDQMRPRTTSV